MLVHPLAKALTGVEEGLIEAKIYMIVGAYLILGLTLFGFDAYVRQKTAQGVAGRLDFMQGIPRSLRWMPIVATLATIYIMAYSIVFIFYPGIQNDYLPIATLQDPRISILGMVLLSLGTIVFVISQFQLGLSYRINLPLGETRLVTTGLYAISRNPLYMGLYIAMTGIFLMIPDWIFLACLIFFIINYHYKIKLLEEPYLRESFVDRYRDYCSRVNRYF